MNFQAANVLVSIQRHVNAVTPVWGLFLFAQSLSQVHINIKNSNWGSLFHLQVHLLHPEVSLQLHIFLRGLQCQVVFLAVNTSSNKFKTNQCMQSHLKCVKTKQKTHTSRGHPSTADEAWNWPKQWYSGSFCITSRPAFFSGKCGSLIVHI